jgi:hypothetical protein
MQTYKVHLMGPSEGANQQIESICLNLKAMGHEIWVIHYDTIPDYADHGFLFKDVTEESWPDLFRQYEESWPDLFRQYEESWFDFLRQYLESMHSVLVCPELKQSLAKIGHQEAIWSFKSSMIIVTALSSGARAGRHLLVSNGPGYLSSSVFGRMLNTQNVGDKNA